MLFYPLDITSRDDAIHIRGKSDGKAVIVTDNYLNYLTVVPTLSFSDERVAASREVKGTYYGEDVTGTRIYTKKHGHVRELAQIIEKLPGVKYVFDADLPVVRKYLIQHKIQLLFGYDVEQNNNVMHWKPTNQIIDFSTLKILAFDIETYAKIKKIDSKKNPMLMIALYAKDYSKVLTWSNHASEHQYTQQCKDEKEMIVQFNQAVKEYSPDIICGYNSDGFDVPYIIDRAQIHQVKLDFGPLGDSFATGMATSTYVTLLPHVDIYNFVKINLRTQLKTQSYSLDNVSQEILGEKKVEVDINQLAPTWDTKDAKQLDHFIKYNLHDSYLCVQLLNKILPNILEFAKLIRVPIDDITRMTYSQLVEWFLITRATDEHIFAPARPSKTTTDERADLPQNEGAFVFKPTPGLYKNVVVFDFRSLYPSLIASLNLDRASMNKSKDATDKVPEFDEELYFAKEPKAFIPKVIEEIIVRRSSIKSEIKAAKTIEEKLLLEARSYNLKILANSMYGYLSFVYARWYCKEAGAATTAYARYYIKKTIDAAKEAGFHILYGDTDSLFLELREKTADDAKAFVATYNKTLPGIMMLQFEDEFACGIFVAARGKEGGAKKRYALLSKSGKFKITGFEYVRQDWCDYARNTQREVIELVLKENDPKKAYAYIKGRITALQARQVDMADLIIRDKLSRELNEYQTNLPHVVLARKLVARGESLGRGSRISYVITQGKGNLYEKVALASDVTLDQIDIDYYVSNQVLAVVGSIMEIFGYNTEDILTNKKQGSLNDFF